MGSQQRGREAWWAILKMMVTVMFVATAMLAMVTPSHAITAAGTSGLSPLATSWQTAYHYVRDDLDVSFSTTANVSVALTKYAAGSVDFVMTEAVIFNTSRLSATYGGAFVQLPLTANAIIIGYNLPELYANETLVLDIATLGRMFAGLITVWNDSAIAALNPTLAARLPGNPIELVYKRTADALDADVTAAFVKALTHEPTFAAALAASDGTLYDILNGAGYSSDVVADRQSRVNGTAYTLGYFTLKSQTGIKVAAMKDANGTTVAASATTVQTAMAYFRASVFSHVFVADISGGGNGSYPLAYLSSVAAFYKTVNTSRNCPKLRDILDYLAWTQVNDYAVTLAQSASYVALDIAYRRTLIDTLGSITCDGLRAITSSYVIGLGGPLPVYSSWVSEYTDSSLRLKYYSGDALTATRYMQSGDIDFGSTVVPLSAETLQPMPDVVAVKTCAHAYTWTYNIPALVGYPPLVFSWELVSDIYLNRVKMWNDTRIKDLNPGVASLLPEAEIIVAYITSAQTSVQASMQALSTMVPEFNATVGPVSLPTFPVVVEEPARTRGIGGLGSMQNLLLSTPNIFAAWVHFWTLNGSPTLNFVQLPNAAGNLVYPNETTIVSAITNHKGASTDLYIMLSGGADSYPMVTFNAFMVRTKTMPDYAKAQALVDWIYWSQTDSSAAQIARSANMVVASLAQPARATLLDQLASVTSGGVQAFSLANCIYEGTVCFDQGTCVQGSCVCNSNRSGEFCESVKSDSGTPLGTILGAVLGSAIPVFFLLVIAAIALGVGCWLLGRSRGHGRQDWEIEVEELEMGDILGAGGYGEVYRAMWKGTEVAVKVIAAEERAISKEMQRSFAAEVEVMTALRHPNVVLFMAACTRPPRMCIVMEFMALGSLYDLIHNELIPDIPLPLKVRLALQAAKGMHFLHSSGIVHRDLKSLNLLLDAKWNLKVSDFGLTCFKGDLKKDAQQQQQGSIHWMAPEILAEESDVDYVLADIYAFGIILWELLTREQPYAGLTPAAIAVAVIRDDTRPNMPSGHVDPDYEKLITDCWHRDPTVRPTFLEVMTRLSAMVDDGNSSSSSSFTSSKMRPSGSATSSSSGVGSSSSMSSDGVGGRTAAIDHVGGVRPPEGEVALVFTDIAKAASLWSACPNAMRDATLLHNETLRSLLAKHRGYEAVFLKEKIVGEGSFCMAFSSIVDALAWCGEAQRKLLRVDWPEELLAQPDVAEEIGGVDDRLVFRGLRVRMGVHVGVPKLRRDPMSRRVEYLGPPVVAAAKVTVLAQGGQVLLSGDVYNKLRNTDLAKEKNRFLRLGQMDLGHEQGQSEIYEMKVTELEPRYFGNFGTAQEENTDSTSGTGKDHSSKLTGLSGRSDTSMDLEKLAGGTGEDAFLTGANLVRWVIKYDDIQIGDQIGTGSYGVVFKGTWKGVDVAVKRFIKQKLDERHLLEFRAEVACLSEMRHPNIVLFIGACLRMPNLCLVTEWVKQGSLKAIIGNSTIKLPWQQRLRMLRDAARGVHYLHTLEPCIVHRDLKTSNLLVDESWNVKVADFGFARIKEDNATMTRCGTPAWTAPEVIRGEHYSELADVYSFGIIMWEMATRKQPYAGRNFMGVTLDVLEGKRPQVPADCPAEYRAMMTQCWKGKPEKRPTMEEVLRFLNSALGELFTEEDDESV